jgi:hypothetical protein
VRLRSLVAGTALAATSVLTLAGPAAAAPPAPAAASADVIGVVHVDPHDPTTATIRVRYSCTGEAGLWISVKQTADRSADPALAGHGSSAISAAMSHSHRNGITCDGRTRVGTFTVDQVEWGFGALAKGAGYVQFCVTDLEADPTSEESLLLSHDEFVEVR